MSILQAALAIAAAGTIALLALLPFIVAIYDGRQRATQTTIDDWEVES